jgi:class 3 adenylate cyclase
VPLYMDRHDVPDATAEDVAQAHANDLAVAGKHRVQFLAYWFDQDHGTIFCFARAAESSDVQAVHAESHGQVANEVIAVAEGDVLSFLGRVGDPATAKDATPAFRAILFTDLESSTALLNRIGETPYLALLEEHDRILRQALGAWRGREVKHTGDGVMASFDLVADAVGCALAMQAAFAGRPVDLGSPELRIRVGIAAGEPVDRDNDIFGRTVHLAARLCGAAGGGEILVSESVSTHPSAVGFRFGEPALIELRGYTEPVKVDRVLGGSAPT